MDESRLYISSKLTLARPMDECYFLSVIKGQDTSNRETREGYKVTHPDGHMSWSPKEAFENANREVTDAEKDLMFPKTQEEGTDPADIDEF